MSDLRACLSCAQEKPLDAFAPFKGKDGAVGRRYRCRDCENSRRKERESSAGKRTPRQHGSKVRNLLTGEKLCPRCRTWKPFAEFAPRSESGRTQHLRSTCRPCEAFAAKQYVAEHATEVRAKRKARRASGADKVRAPIWALRVFARKLGYDPDWLVAEYERHNGRCDICSRTPEEAGGRFKRLAVDHDHASGAFRGFLCFQCNYALGMFSDDPMRLEAAAAYLRQHRPS